MKEKSNIVYFVADQMRSDSMHHMGNNASITPNIDAIVNEGVSFKNAYCQNPVCVPSRCSFLTGLYPHTTGHRTMHFLQNADEPNILKSMKENGYEVIWIGRNDVIPSNRSKLAYCDEYYDGSTFENQVDNTNPTSFFANMASQSSALETLSKSDDFYSFYIGKLDVKKSAESFDWKCVQSALDYIERKSKQPNSKPFFLYVTINFPHPPYGCEDPWYSSIDRSSLNKRRANIDTLENKPSMLYSIFEKQKLGNWSEEKWNELRATYLAMVSRFDYHYGLISDQLKKYSLYDNTNIFVFADHGDYTGDYGIVEKVQNCFENPISNIPLLIKPAKDLKCVPRISKALVELVDLSATIADIADIKLNYTQFGKSLLNTIAGDETHKDAVFCEGGRIHGEEHCMEKGHNETSMYWPRLSTQCTEGAAHTKATMIRMKNLKYTKRLYELDELYDLDQDPYELLNIIDNKLYKSELNLLRARLADYYQETSDVVPNRKDPR